jgi:hypothetical protein
MSLIDSSISPEKVKGDFIKIRLVPLSAVEKLSGILWSGNAKKHDRRGLYDSIERFGFPCIAILPMRAIIPLFVQNSTLIAPT